VVTYIDGAAAAAFPVREVTDERVTDALFEEWAWPVACLFLIVVEFGRVMARYGDRGIRFALIESGVMVERLLQAAQRADLGACAIGGYDDHKLLACVGLDPQWFGVAIALAVGHRGLRLPET
jgi:SagB-type dehydrogenase family enzyme